MNTWFTVYVILSIWAMFSLALWGWAQKQLLTAEQERADWWKAQYYNKET